MKLSEKAEKAVKALLRSYHRPIGWTHSRMTHQEAEIVDFEVYKEIALWADEDVKPHLFDPSLGGYRTQAEFNAMADAWDQLTVA